MFIEKQRMEIFVQFSPDYVFRLSRIVSMSHSRCEETKSSSYPIKICPAIFPFDEGLVDFLFDKQVRVNSPKLPRILTRKLAQ